MLQAHVIILNLYYIIPTLLFLALLGYLLRSWYQVSYSTYGAALLLAAILLSVGYLAIVVINFAFSPYVVGIVYAILVAFIITRWYHISWKDLIGRFYHPKAT